MAGAPLLMGVTKDRSMCKGNLHILGDSGESVDMTGIGPVFLLVCVK